MRTVTYGSVEEILSKYCIGHFQSRYDGESLSDGFTKCLLRTGLGPEREYLMDETSSTIASRYRKGKAPVKQDIISAFLEENARDRIKEAMSTEIIPLVSDNRIPNLIKDFCGIIERDTSISVSSKAVFYSEATRDRLSEFLADILIYAIEIDPREGNEGYPIQTGNLPRRNEFFHGRETELEELKDHFIKGEEVLLLVGAGGIGKTQIALEYAYRNAKVYETIWRVDCRSDESLQQSLLQFVRSRGINLLSEELSEVMMAFRDYFNNHKNWLIIFDGADYLDNSRNSLMSIIPNTVGNGRILITTQNRYIIPKAHIIDIGTFSQEEAISFINERTGLCDSSNAETIVKMLGMYPLALEHAGAYISSTPNQDYQSYIRLLNEYGLQLLDRNISTIEYSATIYAVIKLTFESIAKYRNHDSVSENLPFFMSCCAMGHPSGIAINAYAFINPEINTFMREDQLIPDNLYSKCKTLASICSHELDQDDLIRTAVQFSLISPENDGLYSMHSMIQQAIRSLWDKEDQKRIACYGLAAYHEYLSLPPKTDMLYANCLSQIRFHMRTLTSLVENEYTKARLEFQNALYDIRIGLHNFDDSVLSGFDVSESALFKDKYIFLSLRQLEKMTKTFVGTFRELIDLPCEELNTYTIINDEGTEQSEIVDSLMSFFDKLSAAYNIASEYSDPSANTYAQELQEIVSSFNLKEGLLFSDAEKDIIREITDKTEIIYTKQMTPLDKT